jgi:tungstate transport system substrate-binding protein
MKMSNLHSKTGVSRSTVVRLAMLFAVVSLTIACGAKSEPRSITVASTTSTQNSGLFDWLLPQFTETTGIEVKVVAVGTGQAIRIATSGDADLLLVHHEASERKFVADGLGLARQPIMHNDFVLVGPGADPAGIRGMSDVASALRRIGESEQVFVSRGDDSGTHKKELELWSASGFDPQPGSGSWYREAGSGMGATLNTASAMAGYTLSDRASWVSFGNKGDFEILFEGDPPLNNPYAAIVVNPERHPHVRVDEAQAFVDWLTSARGQAAIAAFRVNGQQLFFPDVISGGSPIQDMNSKTNSQ